MKKLLFTLLLAAGSIAGWAEDLYLVGNALAIGWNIDNALRATVMKETSTNVYEWTGYIKSDGSFKILRASNGWDYGYQATANRVTLSSTESGVWERNNAVDSDNQWQVSENGLYKITFNQGDMLIKAESATMIVPTLTDGYYQIGSADDLVNFADAINKGFLAPNVNAKLTADIDMTGADFTPISCANAIKFSGEFDGQGHSITNLNLDYGTKFGFAGLIGYATGGAVVKNVIVGGSVKGLKRVAGIVGMASGGGTITLTNVISMVNVDATGNDGQQNAGGLVGCGDGTVITATNCANMGSVKNSGYTSGTQQCAAFAGWTSEVDETKTTFTNCWNSGTIENYEGTAILYRNTGQSSQTNCYHVTDADFTPQNGTKIGTSMLASGDLCFLLNGKNISGTNWYQTIGTDDYPFPFSSHGSLATPTATDDWYEISEPWQLYFMANKVNESNSTYGSADIKLTDDIDYRAYTNQASMFGKSSSNPYKGTFDGQNHTVTVGFNNSIANNTALFNEINGATIKNLKVAGNITTDKKFAGGICANINRKATITNCESNVTITDSRTGDNIDGTHGGIVALVSSHGEGVEISNCLFSGAISASEVDGCGGVVGWTSGGSSNVTIKNCLITGTMTVRTSGANDIIARNGANESNNYYIGTFTGISNDENATSATDAQKTSGELCYLLNGSTQGGTNWTQTIGTDDNPIPFNTHKAVYLVSTDYKNLLLTDGKAQIANATDLQDFSSIVNAGVIDLDAELTNDIDMSEEDYTPIGTSSNKYVGTFDGNGHFVKLNINTPTTTRVGFIAYAKNGAYIKNLLIKGSVHGDSYVAGIVGSLSGTEGSIIFENCGNEADITAENVNAGGIFGCKFDGAVKARMINCYNTGDISSKKESGQLTGWSTNTEIENCYTIGECTNCDPFVRLGGDNNTITNCYSDQELTWSGHPTYVTAEQITSGELCYLLNGNQSNIKWYQTIGSDDYPMPFSTSEEVKYVGAAGYTTFYDASNDWELNGDAQAYIGTYTPSGNYLHLTEIDDIPAGTAVVIGGTYYNKVSTTATANTEDNVLLGSTGIPGDGTHYYALSTLGGTAPIGFYPVGNGITIPAGKAYLEISGGQVKGFTFVFDDDATAIESLTPALSEGEGVVYNLAGQRINKMQKGINIVNGKKILK